MSLPGRFLSIGGIRVFHHRAGRGKPLVLLHGWMASHWVWRHVLPTLSAKYDVIALDLPGFGESDRPAPTDYGYDATAFGDTVVGVLDVLDIEPYLGEALFRNLATRGLVRYYLKRHIYFDAALVTEDRLFPPAAARRLGDDLRAAEVTLIPRCGHAPQEERPDELVRTIARFLGLHRVDMRAVS